MAVYKLTDKPRKLPWCADWYEGGRRKKRMFPTKEDAEYCYGVETTSIRSTGLPARKKELEAHTVGEIVKGYRDNKALDNLGYSEDRYRLNGFLKQDICKESLGFIKKQHARAYIRERLKTHEPSTVGRERNLWVQVFKYAIDDLGYENLPNIFEGIRIKGAKTRRQRRLIEEARELQRLISACDSCRGRNKYYLNLGIKLLIGTGMRKEELINLRWEDISVARREIKIRKSKMDYKRTHKGRTIPLPLWCEFQLLHLVKHLKDAGQFNLKDKIFPMTISAFSQAFANVRTVAKVTDLHIHDLRHEAASLFDEMGLSFPQRNHMLGHGPSSQGDAYVHSSNQHIRLILDNYWFRKTGQDKKKTIEDLEAEADILEGATLEDMADLAAQQYLELEMNWKKKQEEITEAKEIRAKFMELGAMASNVIQLKGKT